LFFSGSSCLIFFTTFGFDFFAAFGFLPDAVRFAAFTVFLSAYAFATVFFPTGFAFGFTDTILK
jgi:hypothetical protein